MFTYSDLSRQSFADFIKSFFFFFFPRLSGCLFWTLEAAGELSTAQNFKILGFIGEPHCGDTDVLYNFKKALIKKKLFFV